MPDGADASRVDVPKTAAEQHLLEALGLDAIVVLDDLAPDQRVVRGAFLRAVILALPPTCRRAGFQGCSVSGPLDLEACRIPCALRIAQADFDAEVIVRRARLPRLELADCAMPRLEAPRLELEHALVLRGSSFDRGIDLSGATAPAGIDCQGASVASGGITFVRGTAGTVLLSGGFRACGEVNLRGSVIHGELNCSDATFEAAGGVALCLSGGNAGSVRFVNAACTGEVRLSDCAIAGRVACSGTFTNPTGDALNLNSSDVGPVFLGGGERPFQCHGELNLGGATMRGLSCGPGRIERPGGVALCLSGVEVAEGVILSDVEFVGQVALGHASIRDLFMWRGVRVDDTAGDVPAAVGSFSLDVTNLMIEDSEVRGGATSFVQAHVKGRLSISDSAFINPDGMALAVDQAKIEGALHLSRVTLHGGVMLTQTEVQALSDDLGEGPDGMGSWGDAAWWSLDGLSYQRFSEGADSTVRRRHRWLRHTASFEPAAWRQLAETYRQTGRDADATATLVAMQDDRLARAGLPLHRKLGRWVLRLTIGHGYRPWLAGAWAIGIILAFAVVVSSGRALFEPAGASQVHLQPFLYAVDTFLPVVDLGLADQWTATGWVSWVESAVILLGWLLTTLFVAGFTRVVRS